MLNVQWVDELPAPESEVHPVYIEFVGSSPVELESLSVGARAEARMGERTITITKTKRRGLPWLEPESLTTLTNYRAAQLGFTPSEGTTP